ncbi:MAG: chemotaxis protein CheW [Cyanobacteria bacterium P01_D01_bin.156]
MSVETSKIVKFITFKVADYWFVLPMKAIQKIVHCPPANEGGLTQLGMVQLGCHTVQLLDLYSVFGLGVAGKLPESTPFLLVLRGIQNTFWGIALESPPDLVELPLSEFQTVSANQRFVPKKQWISHIAILSEAKISRTLLFLDLQAVFQPMAVVA